MTSSSGRSIGIVTAARGDERNLGQLHVYDGDGNRVARTEDNVINARRHPLHPEGTAVTIPFIATIPMLNLIVGQRYQWRVSIAEEMGEDWLAGFTVTGEDEQS